MSLPGTEAVVKIENVVPTRRLPGRRNLAVVLLASAAVILGLLAMHATPGVAVGSFVGAESAVSASFAVPGDSATLQPATGTMSDGSTWALPVGCHTVCGPRHDVLMICLLILLLGFVALIVRPGALRWQSVFMERVSALPRGRGPLGRTPSIHLLAISRT